MKRGYLLLTLLVIVLLIVAGCSKYPEEELNQAKQAVNDAQMADAKTNCPDKMDAAEKKLDEAYLAADDEGDYDKAKTLAYETISLANIAKGCPPPPAPTPPPPPPPPPAPPSLNLGAVYFNFNMYNIRPDAAVVLKSNGAVLKQYPDKMVFIEGHCDDRGTAEYNMALGERRAKSAKNYLIGLGVNGKNLKTLSFGESKPADPGHNEMAWAKNRRVEFRPAK